MGRRKVNGSKASSTLKTKKVMGKAESSTLQRQLKPNVPKKNHRGSWKRKVQEMQRLEAKAAKMKAELNHMEQVYRKQKAKLRKFERKNSETNKANQLEATYNAQNNLLIDAILLHLLDD